MEEPLNPNERPALLGEDHPPPQIVQEPVEIDATEDASALSRNGAPKINKYFKTVNKTKASDLHLKAGSRGKLRVGGYIRSIKGRKLSSEEIENMIFEIMAPEQIEAYKKKGSMDFAYQLSDSTRYRINVFRQRGLTSVAARRIPFDILNYEQLHLPPSLSKIADLHQGLVLVSGITGSGKSTTIAAMIEQINQSRACHIVTIEDPIEFMYTDKKAFIKDPAGGPYSDLVKAAEKCTARVIHPGLPGDRSAKDIEKWIARGEKYN